MLNKAEYWINHLGLHLHPEGGHFKEVYRSSEKITGNNLPDRYTESRSFSTSIYFLLNKDEISAFHRIKSDETWYFHDGDELELFIIDENGSLTTKKVGINPETGGLPQLTIKKNQWFSARTMGEFTLLSCNVAPGFDFMDFELAEYKNMLDKYPQHEKLLKAFCLPK